MRTTALCSALFLALAVAPAAAGEFSWTGTYEGFFVCDDVTDGAAGGFGRAMTIAIVQSGDRIDVENDVLVDPTRGVSHTVYRGRVAASAGGDVASGYMEACGGTFPHQELARIFPAATARQPFSFSADTVFVSEAVPGEEGKLVTESCKWSLKRVSTEIPQFEPCP